MKNVFYFEYFTKRFGNKTFAKAEEVGGNIEYILLLDNDFYKGLLAKIKNLPKKTIKTREEYIIDSQKKSGVGMKLVTLKPNTKNIKYLLGVFIDEIRKIDENLSSWWVVEK